MQKAYNRHGQIVSAGDFQRACDEQNFDQQWVREQRQGLTCVECRQPAEFVRTGLGKNGRAAHFRVKGKELTCSLHNPSETSPAVVVTVKPKVEQGVLHTNEVVIPRWDFFDPHEAMPGQPVVVASDAEDGATRRRRYVKGPDEPRRAFSGSMLDILAGLRADPDTPGPTVKLPDRGEVSGSEYFCKFDVVTEAHAQHLPGESHSRLMAYWGKIEKVNDAGSLFLSGSTMAVMVPPKDKSRLKSLLEIANFKEMVGGYVLAEGRLTVSRAQTLLLKLPDLQRMVFLWPPR